MHTVLIIGVGGVGTVTAHKCCQASETFSRVVLASRTQDKCEAVKSRIGMDHVETARVDAGDSAEVAALIEKVQPSVVINTALPYHDLPIMDACLVTGVDYLDTANYETKDEAKFCYKWQWDYHDRFRDRGIMALLGCGFDPGVTNIFCAHAKKKHFDEIQYVDIVDANGGTNGLPFATNFNPEVNIREITQEGKYFENGQWVTIPPFSVSREHDFPGVGPRTMYLLYHEELESLVKHFPEIRRIRFWMTFSEQYLTHLRVLQNVGMTGIHPIEYQGQQIVPLQFLKAVLPDPAKLGARTVGNVSIGCMIKGTKSGQQRGLYIYSVCSHEKCFEETTAQAVSYTTGVPAMIGAKMMVEGRWRRAGVYNVEQFDPDPFLADLTTYGIGWEERVDDDEA